MTRATRDESHGDVVSVAETSARAALGSFNIEQSYVTAQHSSFPFVAVIAATSREGGSELACVRFILDEFRHFNGTNRVAVVYVVGLAFPAEELAAARSFLRVSKRVRVRTKSGESWPERLRILELFSFLGQLLLCLPRNAHRVGVTRCDFIRRIALLSRQNSAVAILAGAATRVADRPKRDFLHAWSCNE